MLQRKFLLGAFASTAIVVPANAQQSSTATGSAAVEIAEPSALARLQELDFAEILVSAAGTAVINPDTDVMTTSSGITHASGIPKAAVFQITPSKRGSIFIRIPQSSVTLTRVSGTETVTVSDWTISANTQSVGQGRHKVVAGNAPILFRIGATLNVGANPKMGTYEGTFEVTVENQ